MTATHSYAYIMSIHKFIKVMWGFAFEKQYMTKNYLSIIGLMTRAITIVT